MNKQTHSLTIEKMTISHGEISAKVIERRSRPYEVRLHCRKWNSAEWDKALAILSSEAFYTAALVNGKLPKELESRFNRDELNFHIEQERWANSCTCKHSNEACKHVEAIYQECVELLTHDPLLLFVLRGLDKSQLMHRLRIIRSHAFSEHSVKSAGESSKPFNESFDKGSIIRAKLLSDDNNPEFWTKEKTLNQILRPIYSKIRHQAHQLLKKQHKKKSEKGD